MHRIDSSSAVATLPTPLAQGSPGYFSHGNPATGTQYTVVTSDWCNSLQEEIVTVIASAGIALNKNRQDQLLAALNAKFAPAGNYQPSIGFAPVQQGGGAYQLPNKVYIGWDNTALRAQVDGYDLGRIAFQNLNNNFAAAQTFGSDANVGGNINVNGNVGAAGTIYSAASLSTNGAISAQSTITSQGSRVRAGLGARSSGDQYACPNVSDFAMYPAGTGYQFLPNNFILQWGNATAGRLVPITFPVAFPNACLCVVANESGPEGWDYGPGRAWRATTYGCSLQGPNYFLLSCSQVYYQSGQAGSPVIIDYQGDGCHWIAVGM